MNPIERNHVRRIGQQGPVLLYAHGFGCHQGMWAGITPAFEASHQQILMDYTGSGPASAAAPFDSRRYSRLDGYAQDLIEVCDALGLTQGVTLPASPLKPGLVGLNLAAALPRLGDDLTLFHRLLARLLDTHDAAWVVGLSAMDSPALQAALHKLRGTASMLGAERVEQLATQAEAQLRQGLPPAELSPQLEALGDAFSQLRQLAEPMLAQARSPAGPTIAADLPAPEQAATRLAELLLLLSQQDLGAADAFDALRPWLCAQGLPSAELGRLQHRIANLDFAPAHQFLTEWQASDASSRQA